MSHEKVTFHKHPCEMVRAKAEQSPFSAAASYFGRQVVDLDSPSLAVCSLEVA